MPFNATVDENCCVDIDPQTGAKRSRPVCGARRNWNTGRILSISVYNSSKTRSSRKNSYMIYRDLPSPPC